MKDKLKSYGKTWHVWSIGVPGRAGDKLPIGPPVLARSFDPDGEAMPGLVEQRDKRLNMDSADKRRQRAEMRSLGKPQSGVDALRATFPRQADSGRVGAEQRNSRAASIARRARPRVRAGVKNVTCATPGRSLTVASAFD